MRQQIRIKDFLNKNIGSYESIRSLPHDASVRRYLRVHTSDKSYILGIDAALSGTDSSTYPQCIVYELFRKNDIPVPEIYAIDNSYGFILQEDAGDILLQNECRRMDDVQLVELYKRCIDTMINIQAIKEESGIPPFDRSFDVDKLMCEFDFFTTYGLKGYWKCADDDLINEIRQRFIFIAKELQVPDCFVLNHRDYHSRNILIKNGQPRIIDYQDARMGLPHYDLVSLLEDPYAEIADVEVLKAYYYQHARSGGIINFSGRDFYHYYRYSAFQRLIKAVGTYTHQLVVKQNLRYAEDIKTALNRAEAQSWDDWFLEETCELIGKAID